MKLPWMSRADRRRWRAARTTADLGDLMARWLEGDIASRPGYAANYGPDEETDDLVPTLAAVCRAGFITTDSQPGFTGTGADGAHWEQRAVVEGLVADPALFHRLVDAAYTAGLLVRINDYTAGRGIADAPIDVTTREGEITTIFGARVRPVDMTVMWPGLHRDLYEQVAHGVYLTIAAPEYGPAGDRLWQVLDIVTGRCPAPAEDEGEDDDWSKYVDSDDELRECTLCGAPYHGTRPYCTEACADADADADDDGWDDDGRDTPTTAPPSTYPDDPWAPSGTAGKTN